MTSRRCVTNKHYMPWPHVYALGNVIDNAFAGSTIGHAFAGYTLGHALGTALVSLHMSRLYYVMATSYATCMSYGTHWSASPTLRLAIALATPTLCLRYALTTTTHFDFTMILL